MHRSLKLSDIFCVEMDLNENEPRDKLRRNNALHMYVYTKEFDNKQ